MQRTTRELRETSGTKMISSPGRRSTSTRKRQPQRLKKSEQPGKVKKRLLQLIVSAAIFALIVVFKLAFPQSSDAVKDVLTNGISGSLDYRAAFEAVGKAVTGGGDITEVFNALTSSISTLNENTGSTPPPSLNPSAEPRDTDITPAQTDPFSTDDVSDVIPQLDPFSASDVLQPETKADEAPAGVAEAEPSSPAVQSVPETNLSDAAKVSKPPSDSDVALMGAKTPISAAPENTAPPVSSAAPSVKPLSAVEIENLSFSMTAEEIIDDTPATEFEIPPPDKVEPGKFTLKFKYTTPAKGAVTSPFGYRDHPINDDVKFHYGIDIAAKNRSDIKCFAAGTVEAAGKNTVYGNFIKVKHPDGFSSFYGHCSKLLVKTGDKVKLGQTIALVGSTGNSTGPHLHFEMRHNNSIIDPTYYVKP